MKENRTIFDNLIWLTNEEAARYLRISPNAFRIMRSRSKEIIQEYRLGNRLRFKKSDLDTLIESSLSKRGIK
jgi:excisionase family DNA binding protein